MEAYNQWNDVAVHSTAKRTKLLLYACSYYVVYVLMIKFSRRLLWRYLLSERRNYVSQPCLRSSMKPPNLIQSSLDPYSIQTILGGVSVIGTIPALVGPTLMAFLYPPICTCSI